MTLFHEIYGLYYRTVEKILAEAVAGQLTPEKLKSLAGQTGFAESGPVIVAALREQRWPLLRADLTATVEEPPHMPLTILEKRWLKSILQDPRIQLFDLPEADLTDVEPLFTPADVHVFDRCSDGDPYEDPLYRRRFRLILQALREGQPLQVSMKNRYGKSCRWYVMPQRLEYSGKDDKFRLYTVGSHHCSVLNLARLTYATPCGIDRINPTLPPEVPITDTCRVTMELYDRRNALERVMLHFAHFRKTAEKQEQGRYLLTVEYDRSDETELLIRILSFGPFVKVVEPTEMVERIKERLERQNKLLNNT